jgi:mannosyltransferase
VRGAWRQIAATFAGAGVLTLLLYAPMLLDVSVFFTTRTASQNEVATPAWAMLAAVSGLRIGFGPLWAIALSGMVFLAGIWSYATTRAAVALLFLLPLPVTLLSALVLQRPIFPRFFFFALGFMLLVAVRGAMSAGVQLARVGPVWLSPRRTGAAAVVLVTLAAVALSLRSLPYGYRYPKQNYADAVSFVDANRRGADAVAVVGETGATPVLKYLGRSWQRIDRAGQLRELRDRGHQVWVIDTFPAYIQAGQPELWHSLQSDCIVAGEFEGTVAGGTVHVRRCR